MSNINVRKRIERISNDIDELVKHVAQYSDIDAKDARFVDNIATSIAEQASRLAAAARAAQGDRSAVDLPKKIRKALGFTHP